MATLVRQGMIFYFDSSRSINSDKTDPKVKGPNNTYVDCHTLCGPRPHIVISDDKTNTDLGTCTVAPIRSVEPASLHGKLPQLDLQNGTHAGLSYIDISNLVSITIGEVSIKTILGFATPEEMRQIELKMMQFYAPSYYRKFVSGRLTKDELNVDYIIDTIGNIMKSTAIRVDDIQNFITKLTMLQDIISGSSTVLSNHYEKPSSIFNNQYRVSRKDWDERQYPLFIAKDVEASPTVSKSEPLQHTPDDLDSEEKRDTEDKPTKQIKKIVISDDIPNANDRKKLGGNSIYWTTERHIGILEYCATYGFDKCVEKYGGTPNTTVTRLHKAIKDVREHANTDYALTMSKCPVHKKLRENEALCKAYVADHTDFEKGILGEKAFLERYDLRSAWQAKYQRYYLDNSYQIED